MSIPDNARRLLQVALLIGLVSLLEISARSASDRPPTLDPSYGLPLPTATKATAAPLSAAQWIWAGIAKDNQTVYLRRKFDLQALPKSAALYITADDFFTLLINGKQVDQSQPDPKDINVWQHVHQVNVATYLTVGVNVLAVRAVNAGGAAGVVARLEMTGQAPIETDARWKAFSEATPPNAWTGTAFNDADWPAALVIAPLEGQPWNSAGGLQGWPGYEAAGADYLAHLTLPFAHVVETHPGTGKIDGAESLAGHINAVLTVTPAPTGVTDSPNLTLDFGKEIAGRVQIEPLTPGSVQIGTGESQEEATKSPWGGMHSLALTPGTKAFTPYSAFRYVRLVFPSSAAPPVKMRVTMDHKYYPVEYKGSFACSDPMLTQLWYTGAYTAHLCMQEDIWDAPKRDRARWIGDLHVSGRVIDTVFADKFLMEQTMQRLRDDAQGGQPADALPKSHVNGIPGYSCAWICTLADFQRYIGDNAFLAKQHQPLLTLLEYMQGELDDNHLFANKRGQWPYADWSPGFDGDTPQARAATQLFYIQAAHDAVFLLKEMGDKSNADKYAAWADTLTQAARQSLPDAATNTYGSRLEENAMAIYSGTATPAQTQAIAQTILSPDSAAWDKTGTPPYNNGVISPYYNNYVIYALSMAGHNQDALRVLRDYWGGMLAEGATTCWEAYDPHWTKQDFHANLYADGNHGYFVSLCHGWSSGPTSWLTERVLGVRPTGSGFATAEIAPDLGDLQWAEGTVPTPRGPIHARVEKKNGGLNLSLALPPGVTAAVSVSGRQITLTGPRKYGSVNFAP